MKGPLRKHPPDVPNTVYDRECTADEIAILEADAAALRAHERAEEEALRDQWFAALRQELNADQGGPA